MSQFDDDIELEDSKPVAAPFDDDVDPYDPELDDDLDEDDVDDDDADDLDDDDADDDLDDDADDDDVVDDYEDATEDEVDFVVAMYREDGEPIAQPLPFELANDLEELITQLRRLPGDAGALGAVSIDSEFFVLVRVRGRTVQVVLSDGVAANDWPIARDVADFLGHEVPDPDDESEPMGDLDMLQDVGVSEFDLGALSEDIDEESTVLVAQVATKMGFSAQFKRAVEQMGAR